MPSYDKLPPDIKHRPEIVHLRLEDHESRLTLLERGSQNVQSLMQGLWQKPVKTPVGDLPLPLVLSAAGFIAWKYPDMVLKLFGS